MGQPFAPIRSPKTFISAAFAERRHCESCSATASEVITDTALQVLLNPGEIDDSAAGRMLIHLQLRKLHRSLCPHEHSLVRRSHLMYTLAQSILQSTPGCLVEAMVCLALHPAGPRLGVRLCPQTTDELEHKRQTRCSRPQRGTPY